MAKTIQAARRTGGLVMAKSAKAAPKRRANKPSREHDNSIARKFVSERKAIDKVLAKANKKRPTRDDLYKLAKSEEREPDQDHDESSEQRAVESSIALSNRSEQDSAEEAIVGEAFVRMINVSGLVRGVIAKCVASRLCDGYKFIQGEPTAPGFVGEPDECLQARGDASFFARPRNHAKPNTDKDGLKVWLNELEKDFLEMQSKFPELQWNYMHFIRNALPADERNFGGVLP